MSKQDVEEEGIEGSSSATLTDCYCKDIPGSFHSFLKEGLPDP